MRIIAGTWRGRKLVAPAGRETRPTSERAREAIFSILGERVAGARWLDLFAGTGAMSLEALSRGARQAVLAENSPPVLRVLQANIGTLDAAARVTIIALPVSRAVQILSGGEPFDLVYADPPYAFEGWQGLLAELATQNLLAPGAWILAEHEARRALPVIEFLRERRRVRYGDSAITILERAA